LELMPTCTSLFGNNYVEDYSRPYSWASLKSLTISPAKTPFYSLTLTASLSCIYPEQYFRLNAHELFNYNFSDMALSSNYFSTNLITYMKVIVIATKGFKYYQEIKITTFF